MADYPKGQRKDKVNQEAKRALTQMRPYQKDPGASLKVHPVDKFDAT